MSEGWEDCPVLPVGWKRREVFRRSGATIGKSDTYYMSPTSERFRSKVELVKHFGDSLDLTYFDFKKGIILPQNSKIRKAAKRSSTSSCEGEEHDKRPTPRKKARVSATTPPPTSPSQLKVGKGSATSGLDSEPMDTLIACCEDCQQWVPGVMFGARKKKFKFYCAECRARRREVGRKLNYYKRFGCGECSSCTLAGDCGVCRGCLLRTAEPTRNWKCVKRRCHKLRDIKAEATCRKTTGKPKKKANSQFEGVKKAMKKVKAEPVALVKEPVKAIKPDPVLEEEDGGEELQGETDWQNKEKEHHIPAQGHTAQESPGQLFTAMPILGSEDVRSDYSVKSEFLLKGTRTRRSNRCCGECEACLMPVDCGSCDFCQDKAKFGGFNTLRQKCRWKQCLQFASKRLLPRETQSQHPERKEPGFWSGHRRWRENSFASRKVARAIQAAKKRKIWQALPSTSEGGGQDREGQGNRKPSGRLHREPVPLGGQTEDFQRTELRVQREIETPDSTEGRAQCQQEISVKTPALAEPHDRPSVIKETSSEHKRRQPIEEPLTHQHAGKPRVKADISERQAEPHLTATPKRKLESLSNRSISQELQQRNWSGGPANRNVPHQERDSEVIPPLIVSPVSRNSKGEQRTTSNQQSASPKRPAEPEVSAAGVPSNSQIVRATAPAPSPAYRKSTPAAREGGQLGASQCPEGRAGASASDDDVCGVPVITQIFSLGSPYMMMNLEPRLRTFMQELMLLPLPASWVVCSSLGPDIQLLQLSRKSPVWDAAVQIRPGFTFHVLVRGLAVPLGHRLYRSHPARLGSVDDVVELIGDLERYRVCAGYPQHRHAKAPPAALAALLPRERSAYCEVLVDKEHCFQCSGNL